MSLNTQTSCQVLTMEGRMTVCNMSIEGGARAGLISPDETTVDCADAVTFREMKKNTGYLPTEAELKYWSKVRNTIQHLKLMLRKLELAIGNEPEHGSANQCHYTDSQRFKRWRFNKTCTWVYGTWRRNGDYRYLKRSCIYRFMYEFTCAGFTTCSRYYKRQSG